MMELLLRALIVVLCAVVFTGAVCRLDMLRARYHSGAWIALYTFAAIFAFGLALDVLHGRAIAWHQVAGMAALALQLLNTRAQWANGIPPLASKGGKPCS